MTDRFNHPLTDDVLKQIGCTNSKARVFDTLAMRTAYDLGRDEQLAQVIAWLATNLDFACYLTSDGYASDGRDKKDVYAVIQDLKKAMRPTTQEEK